MLPFYPSTTGLVASLRQLSWTSIALAFAITGLKVGFLLAYRSGWDISLGPLISNVAVGLVLLPIGLVLFKEKLSGINALGVGVCLIGLVLINYRS